MHHSFARRHATRWIPLWCLLLVFMSLGVRAASETCSVSHCSSSEQLLEHAMPCGSFVTALSASVVISQPLGMLSLQPERPYFPAPNNWIPAPPVQSIERPPRLLVI